MYLGLRELKFARGRFSLIVAVVALMTLLVGFLTGLTGGLASQNISGLMKLPADSVVFSMSDGSKPAYSGSSVTAEQSAKWQDAAGVDSVQPLGISSVLVESGDTTKSYVMFAADPGEGTDAPQSGITLGQSAAAALGVAAGDTVTLAGSDETVAAVIPDQYYSHREVVWASLDTWHSYLANTMQPESYATVLLVSGNAETVAADAAAGTVTEKMLPSLLALDSFKSEIGSLGMMIGMLVGIATLVVGVFFLVWSMQRQRDIAVLKAMGAKTLWLVKDALGQALVVLFLGAGIGIAATLGLGSAVVRAMPFVINAPSLLLPAVVMILAGVVGALVSLRQITRVDPNTALQAAAG